MTHFNFMYLYLEKLGTEAVQLQLPLHSVAMCHSQLSKTARKQGLLRQARQFLAHLYTMPDMPSIDVYYGLYQEMKIALAQAAHPAPRRPPADTPPQLELVYSQFALLTSSTIDRLLLM